MARKFLKGAIAVAAVLATASLLRSKYSATNDIETIDADDEN